jgi:hypothetical protein
MAGRASGPRSRKLLMIEACVIAAITGVAGFYSVQMYRDAKPAPQTNRFDGLVDLQVGGSPEGATMDAMTRSYVGITIVVGSRSRDPYNHMVIESDDLLSRDVHVTLTLGFLPEKSAVSIRLTGDARLVPESIEFDHQHLAMHTGIENGMPWQEFVPSADRFGGDGESNLAISGTLVAPPVTRSGADYDARMPTCKSAGPPWVIGIGEQIPRQSCRIWFGETAQQIDLLSVAPDLKDAPEIGWEGPLFGYEPVPRFRLRDRGEADRLDLLFYLSSGLLGIAGAGLFELILKIVGLLGMARESDSELPDPKLAAVPTTHEP